eukprot:Polyplicarium_translucidae@DN3343_c0_g1_i1.p1
MGVRGLLRYARQEDLTEEWDLFSMAERNGQVRILVDFEAFRFGFLSDYFGSGYTHVVHFDAKVLKLRLTTYITTLRKKRVELSFVVATIDEKNMANKVQRWQERGSSKISGLYNLAVNEDPSAIESLLPSSATLLIIDILTTLHCPVWRSNIRVDRFCNLLMQHCRNTDNEYDVIFSNKSDIIAMHNSCMVHPDDFDTTMALKHHVLQGGKVKAVHCKFIRAERVAVSFGLEMEDMPELAILCGDDFTGHLQERTKPVPVAVKFLKRQVPPRRAEKCKLESFKRAELADGIKQSRLFYGITGDKGEIDQFMEYCVNKKKIPLDDVEMLSSTGKVRFDGISLQRRGVAHAGVSISLPFAFVPQVNLMFSYFWVYVCQLLRVPRETIVLKGRLEGDDGMDMHVVHIPDVEKIVTRKEVPDEEAVAYLHECCRQMTVRRIFDSPPHALKLEYFCGADETLKMLATLNIYMEQPNAGCLGEAKHSNQYAGFELQPVERDVVFVTLVICERIFWKSMGPLANICGRNSAEPYLHFHERRAHKFHTEWESPEHSDSLCVMHDIEKLCEDIHCWPRSAWDAHELEACLVPSMRCFMLIHWIEAVMVRFVTMLSHDDMFNSRLFTFLYSAVVSVAPKRPQAKTIGNCGDRILENRILSCSEEFTTFKRKVAPKVEQLLSAPLVRARLTDFLEVLEIEASATVVVGQRQSKW